MEVAKDANIVRLLSALNSRCSGATQVAVSNQAAVDSYSVVVRRIRSYQRVSDARDSGNGRGVSQHRAQGCSTVDAGCRDRQVLS